MNVSSVNKIRGIGAFVIFGVVLVFGIAFLTLFLVFSKPIPENYVQTEATIVKIEEKLSPVYDDSDGIGPDDYEHTVFVDYSYDGKEYKNCEYGNYSSSMKEGDKVVIYLNPDDPAEFRSDDSGNFVFVIIGIVIIAIGVIGIGYNIYQKKRSAA